MASEWVSIKDAAERLGVSADTIRRRRERGELAGRKQPTAQGYVWEIEVPAAAPASEPTESPAQDLRDLQELELVQLRERVAGLERERGEIIAQRDAWQEQARQSSEAEKELRRLVLQAQSLAQALPAGTGGDEWQSVPETHTHAPQRPDRAAPRPSLWARLLGRSQGT